MGPPRRFQAASAPHLRSAQVTPLNLALLRSSGDPPAAAACCTPFPPRYPRARPTVLGRHLPASICHVGRVGRSIGKAVRRGARNVPLGETGNCRGEPLDFPVHVHEYSTAEVDRADDDRIRDQQRAALLELAARGREKGSSAIAAGVIHPSRKAAGDGDGTRRRAPALRICGRRTAYRRGHAQWHQGGGVVELPPHGEHRAEAQNQQRQSSRGPSPDRPRIPLGDKL